MSDSASRYATGGAHIHAQKVAYHSRELDADRHVASKKSRHSRVGLPDETPET
jgi:hypothetical protein